MTTLALAVVAAACSSAPGAPLSVEDYAVALQEVETEFGERAPDPASNPEDRDQFAVGGDLTVASILYTEFDKRLAGWRAITAPTDLEEEHNALVHALGEVQEAVGKYLAEAATETTDFDFDTIGPVVGPLLRETRNACLDLDRAIKAFGESVDFAENCTF